MKFWLTLVRSWVQKLQCSVFISPDWALFLSHFWGPPLNYHKPRFALCVCSFSYLFENFIAWSKDFSLFPAEIVPDCRGHLNCCSFSYDGADSMIQSIPLSWTFLTVCVGRVFHCRTSTFVFSSLPLTLYIIWQLLKQNDHNHYS